MVHARNASPEQKAHAVLALAEYCVRQDVSPDDCSDSDLKFMNESAEILCRDLSVLREQAAAQSTHAWRESLRGAHSMRCVSIDREHKDEKRQRMFRCDGCGRQEKWCGLAIDLAGSPQDKGVDTDAFLRCGRGDSYNPFSEQWPGAFDTFREQYNKDLANPESSDMGRYYLGKTCHRKAQLCFIANTMVQEMMYNAKQLLTELPILPDPTELHTVDDEAPQDFIDRKDQLELCIADERRGDMPDVMVDGGFWDQIDEHRLDLTDGEIRQKAAGTLKAMGGEPRLPTGEDQMSDDSEDDFVPSDDYGEEQDDELDAVEDDAESAPSGARGGWSQVTVDNRDLGAAVDDGNGWRHTAPPKKRHCVIEDDEDEDAPGPSLARAQPPRKRVAEPSRKSRRQRNLAPDAEVAAAPVVEEEEEEEEDDGDEDVLVSSLARPRPPVPRNQAEQRTAAPTAVQVARNMRIPCEGEQPRLPSRQATLLGLINVQKDLILKREAGLAAQVGAAVLTMQELLELVERGRVGQ
jgi:hypothetical protein